jgi:hypothetical protein
MHLMAHPATSEHPLLLFKETSKLPIGSAEVRTRFRDAPHSSGGNRLLPNDIAAHTF